jgi:predicted transcriptional regulator
MKLIETRADFKTWCEDIGYTKDELAALFGVTRQTIYNWMEGKAKTQNTGFISDNTKSLAAEKYDRVPQMLTLAIFALEQLGRDHFLKGQAVRKRTGQSC